ncbi:hypothetical protein P4O66_004597 [Electrophorus voltai]|uniref:Uncharacterized protein n=1 Tax=Electrophorus voltai TaxID=2609070 RepID=A0AAD8ZLG2_9TELE|nr:hypothetical protein P4O66_004597 [Electrophorus voltai]
MGIGVRRAIAGVSVPQIKSLLGPRGDGFFDWMKGDEARPVPGPPLTPPERRRSSTTPKPPNASLHAKALPQTDGRSQN